LGGGAAAFPGYGGGGGPVYGADAPIGPGGAAPIASLTPRGASSLTGTVNVKKSGRQTELEVVVKGVGRGRYSVGMTPNGCPAQVPTEVLLGESDTDELRVEERRHVQGTKVLGELDVDDRGEGRLETSLSKEQMGQDVVAVFIREEGAVNPPLGDKFGIVGCGLVRIPADKERG
jgi:hypothetical protein